jgi:hypothetical protein
MHRAARSGRDHGLSWLGSGARIDEPGLLEAAPAVGGAAERQPVLGGEEELAGKVEVPVPECPHRSTASAGWSGAAKASWLTCTLAADRAPGAAVAAAGARAPPPRRCHPRHNWLTRRSSRGDLAITNRRCHTDADLAPRRRILGRLRGAGGRVAESVAMRFAQRVADYARPAVARFPV